MSDLYENAKVAFFFGDYIAIDGGGKLNAIGLGVNILGLQPNTSPPLSAPFTIVTVIEIPRRFAGQQYAMSLELRDLTTDSAVQVPQGPTGKLDALRIQQMVKVEPPNVPGVVLPEEAPCRTQMVLAFGQGLPLTANHAYEWRVSIDGRRRKPWGYVFIVLGPPPQPLFGGPIGPASIPNLPTPDDEEPEAADR